MMMKGRKFRLDRANGKMFGVCAGIARHMGWDATFVRVGVVVLTLAGGFPWTLIAYAATAMIAKNVSAAEPEPAMARMSAYDLKHSMTDVDRRMAEVESYVTTQNNSLAREIESLR
jgi:phage shock protein C